MAKYREFAKNRLLEFYRTMLTARLLDEKMLILLKQRKGYFHIGCSGHEAAQVMHLFAGLPLMTALRYCTRPGWRGKYCPRYPGSKRH